MGTHLAESTAPADARALAAQTAWRVLALAAAVVLVLAIVVAVFLPYGEWDAMSFGAWSRQIADHWPAIHFDSAGVAEYQRPLFYVLQGTVWHVFGFHVALGRLLSLAFAVLFAASIALLATRTLPYRPRLTAWIAVGVVLLVAPLERYASAGLSDVPLAALLALAGLFVLTGRRGWPTLGAIAAAAAAAGLTKTSAAAGLVGLAVAALVRPRGELREGIEKAGAVLAGLFAALAWNLGEAHREGLGLLAFLKGGTDGFYADLAAARRREVLPDPSWLGPELRVLLAFGLVYAVARLALSHRRAVLVALPGALLWSWLGPIAAGAGGPRAGLFATGGTVEQAATLVLAGCLAFAVSAPEGAVASRRRLVQAIVWALPPFLVWALRLDYDTRLLSPAWPALVMLAVWAFVPVVAGALEGRAMLVAIPVAALVALVAYSADDLNGLGRQGWISLREAGLSGLADGPRMENLALGGDFAAELAAVRTQTGGDDRILTYDRRLPFFYGSRVDIAAPASCDQLGGRRVFVLLESDEVRQRFGDRADPRFWQACKTPRATLVDERPGAYAVFITGTPRSQEGTCGAAPAAGLTVEFGRFRTRAAADRLLANARRVGFVQAEVEQVGCSLFTVVEHGIPSEAVGRSIIGEARAAHLPARLVSR